MSDAVIAPQTAAPVRFRIGAVIAQSFAVTRKRLAAFWLLGLVTTAPLYAYIYVANESMNFDPVNISPDLLLRWIGLAIGQNAIDNTLLFLLSAMIAYGTLQELRGRPSGIGETVSKGLGCLFPLIGVMVLAIVPLYLGLIFFVVPGLILVAMWWVIIPVLIMERPGLFATFGRSRRLTKGNRWRILGLFLMMILGQAAITVALGLALDIGWDDGRPSEAALAASWVIAALYTAFECVISATSYYYLRVETEGLGIDDTAAVFD